MPLKHSGSKRARRALVKITPAIEAEFERANRENAELIVDVAKALIPSRSGESRSKIRNQSGQDTSQIIDFGPLSKILEGGTDERTTKTGASRGKGPARPFVGPAMKGTQTKRDARNRRAVKQGLRIAKGG